jgi:hypothetical protein
MLTRGTNIKIRYGHGSWFNDDDITSVFLQNPFFVMLFYY